MITPEYFDFLDFWFYEVGVNLCPADTKNKRISENWKAMQTAAIPAEVKQDWAFIRGAAAATEKQKIKLVDFF